MAALIPAPVLAWQAGETQPQLVIPVRVSEAVRELDKLSGKMVAIIGRFSFRETGRYLSERPCEGGQGGDERVIRVTFETAARSASITRVEFDGGAVRRELATVKRCNTLKKIRYGSTEYERWAMVYGRLEQPRKSEEAAPPPDKEFPNVAASVFCGGDAAIVSLVDL